METWCSAVYRYTTEAIKEREEGTQEDARPVGVTWARRSDCPPTPPRPKRRRTSQTGAGQPQDAKWWAWPSVPYHTTAWKTLTVLPKRAYSLWWRVRLKVLTKQNKKTDDDILCCFVLQSRSLRIRTTRGATLTANARCRTRRGVASRTWWRPT